jgi:lysozyme
MNIGTVVMTSKRMLLFDEGKSLMPYKDSAGLLTIGIGRCLDRKGISDEEADFLFTNDVYDAISQCQNSIPFFANLDVIRQSVLVDMCFNLGINGLLNFKNMLSALEGKNYPKAADEMIDSSWYKQVGQRSKRLKQMMRTGILSPDYEVEL